MTATEYAPRVPSGEPAKRLARVRRRMKEAGVKGLLIADDDDFMRPEGGNVRFLANVAVPFPFGEPITPIIVLPDHGEPTLVVPACGWDCLPGMLAKDSWIQKISSLPPTSLMDKVAAMTTGVAPAQATAELVATALREAGLETGHIGVCGGYRGLEETRELLPQARIEPASIVDETGRQHDLVAFERTRTRTAYELECMKRAQASIEAGMHTFERVVVPGNSYGKAYAEIEHSMKIAGADEIFFGASRGRGPVGTYAPPGWVQGTYQTGDMVAFELNARVGGYWAQFPRTWVVGKQPTKVQSALYEVAQRSFEAMKDRLVVGITGAELFEAANSVIEPTGFQPWARFGHGIGISLQEWFSVFLNDRGRVQDGQSVVLHAAVINPQTGEEALFGEQLVMLDGRAELLRKLTSK